MDNRGRKPKKLERDFIEKHWEEMTDHELYEAMLLKDGLHPASEVAVTRMRQRMGLIRSDEECRNLRWREKDDNKPN